MICGLHAVLTDVWYSGPFLLTGKGSWSSLSGKVNGTVRIPITTADNTAQRTRQGVATDANSQSLAELSET